MFQINRELAAFGIEWTPKRLYYLETWRYPEVESPTHWNIRDGFLEGFQVEDWLNQRGEFSPPIPPAEVGNGSRGGIRLLGCDYHLFPKTCVGMSHEAFGLVESRFHLHPATLPALEVATGTFSRHFDSRTHGGKRISIILKAPQKYEIGNYMLSLTYDMSSRWTTALLAGESIVDLASTVFDRSLLPLAPMSPCDVVREYLMSSPTLWDHPLMLPCIVLGHHLRRLQYHCNRDLTPSVMGIEAQLGVTRVGRRNFDARPRDLSTIKDGPVARAQSEHLTVTINTQLTRVGFTAHNPKWNYEASALLVKILTEIAAFRPALRPEANEEILGVLDHNITLAKSLEDNILGLQKRLELQLNVLYSFVAQTDNRLSARLAATAGRDSTSMKILAFITTIFLPGSYVATLFSMNMFNWEDGASDPDSSGSGGSTISPQFWIYWTVAAPLTALTLAGWALWWSFEKHRYDEHLEGNKQNIRVKIPPWWRRILENRETLNPELAEPLGVVPAPDQGPNEAVKLEIRLSRAAVLVEGMQGAGGCIPGSADFLHAIQDAARGNGIIFILDEVMTSRLAPGGLQSILLHPIHGTPLEPDLTTFGKWIGGGLSIGAFGGRRDLILNNLGDELRSGLQELAKGTKIVVTGVGAVMNIHFARASEPSVVARISDLEVKPGSLEVALRDLLWFYLIERGFWIARRRMISLILGTSVEEAEQLKNVVGSFLEDFQELVSA
ncbi:hypothetical protein BDW72DRAFT_197898 [Aspergillus terricola var. indicus]